MNKLNLIGIGMFILIGIIGLASASLNVSLSDQASNVKNSSNALVSNGNLTIYVYDNITAGNLVYSENFTNAIINGSWNVMLGENLSNPLALDYGTIYYKDYVINGEDVDFQDYNGTTVERKYFYSPLGELNVTSNITTTETGFFGWLGSLANRITGLFVQDINASGSVNVTGDVLVGGNLTLGGTAIDDWSDINGSGSGSGFGTLRGFTASTYNGNITNGSNIGYVAANAICNAEYSGSHFCLEVEIMNHNVGNTTTTGQYWMAKGAPGYTAAANDCEGWTKVTSEIGPFWDYTENAGVGSGKLAPCSSTLRLACCGGS